MSGWRKRQIANSIEKENTMALMSEFLNKVEEDFTVTRCNNGFVIKQAGRQQDGEWKLVKLVCATTEELDVQIANIHTIPLE